MSSRKYDALLVVSFGGPEGMEDVMPFLRNVTRGRNVPDERLQLVAHHYELFGGVSPINQQNRDLISALEREFAANKVELPIYWGNRNWHPLLKDTVQLMANDGVKRALAFVTSAYSSYSGCRQYIDDISRACAEVGENAPKIDKLMPFFDHPSFLDACNDRLSDALEKIPAERRAETKVVFTAHSIPTVMAAGCDYERQLQFVACELTRKHSLEHSSIAYQSRSGPAAQSWLEPDVCDWIKAAGATGAKDIVIHPIGFVSDHMEVRYDLDTEAKALCDDRQINMIRASTVGTHPTFVKMVLQLVRDYADYANNESDVSTDDVPVCPATCCPSGR